LRGELAMSIGNRIKQIRLARGFSLDELAVEMGGIVTKQAISKYEGGKSEPSLRVLNALSTTLGVKTAYFYENPSYSIQFHGFRKKASFGIREQEKVQSKIAQLLEDRVKLQQFSGKKLDKDFPISFFSACKFQDIEKAAIVMRNRWNLGFAPISSVVGTLEENLIHVLELDIDNKFDGQSVTINEDGNLISVAVVSRKVDSGERQRLTLLHELGHIVLKPLQEKNINENAAFHFASAFLIPEVELKNLVGEHRQSFDIEELILLKKRFGISIQALLYRMKDLCIISENQHRDWCITINKNGWKKEEPAKLDLEESQWLRRTVYKGYAEGWISHSEAAKIIGEPVKHAENLTLRERKSFMKLPIEQRRKILEKQAQDLTKLYAENDNWKENDSADFIDY
jgi:Zn-dependent peptidase ImmA (M78 family)/DNA-binding XRE family transcriptional regulator